MAEWIGKLLEAAPIPGEWKRAEAPPNSNVPTGNDGRHKPQERDEDHHEDGSEYQGGRKGAYEWGHGPSGHGWRSAGWSNTLKNDEQRSGGGDLWQAEEPQGTQGGQGSAGEALPGDPWSAYKKKHQGQVLQGDQQRSWGSQHWQSRADQTDQPAPARQRDRRAPEWEEQWKAGTSHKEMRYGDWKCGNWPACRFPNHAYKQFCKMCGDPNKTPSGSSPRIPGRPPAGAEPWSCRTTPVLAAPARTPSRARKALRQCTIPRGTGPCLPLASVGTCGATPRSPSCYGRRRSSTLVVRPRLAAPGRLRHRCSTWWPTTRTARAPSCPTSLRTLWRKPGGWATTPCAASSWGTGAASGVTRTPRRSSISGGTGRRLAAPWEWPSCRSGRTCPSPTPDSWRTAASSLGCTSPLTGCKTSPAGASAGKSSPPSCHDGPRTGSLGVTCWWEEVSPQSRTATPRTRAPRQEPRPGERPGAAALRTEGKPAGAVGGSGGHGVEPPRSGNMD